MDDRERPAAERDDPDRDEFESIFGNRAAEARDWYEREYKPINPEPAWRSFARKLTTPIVALALLIWKAKFIFVAIFKFKIFTVAGSMLVSLAVYMLLFTWKAAIAIIVLLFVHEMGHALEAKRQGLDVSAPMFIPLMGAVIVMRQMPANAWREAQVAIAGPIVGSIGAAAAWGLGAALESEFLQIAAYMGFFLNLFNLIPFGSLDGGRIAVAIHPALWIVGLAMLLALVVIAPNPILILILVLLAFDAWTRWRSRNNPENVRYRTLSPGKRIAVAGMYVGLIALLVLGMDATFIEKDFGDV